MEKENELYILGEKKRIKQLGGLMRKS